MKYIINTIYDSDFKIFNYEKLPSGILKIIDKSPNFNSKYPEVIDFTY